MGFGEHLSIKETTKEWFNLNFIGGPHIDDLSLPWADDGPLSATWTDMIKNHMNRQRPDD